MTFQLQIHCYYTQTKDSLEYQRPNKRQNIQNTAKPGGFHDAEIWEALIMHFWMSEEGGASKLNKPHVQLWVHWTCS